jgi:hypothetical protein
VSDHDRHPSWTSALLEVITQPIVLPLTLIAVLINTALVIYVISLLL